MIEPPDARAETEPNPGESSTQPQPEVLRAAGLVIHDATGVDSELAPAEPAEAERSATGAADSAHLGGGAGMAPPARGRGGRWAVVALLLSLPVLGAGIGAVIQRSPSSVPFRARAIVLPPILAGGQPAPTAVSQMLASVVRAGAVSTETGPPGTNTLPRMRATNLPGGALAVEIQGSTPQEAIGGANAVASQLVALGDLLIAGRAGHDTFPIGDFEHGMDGWGAYSVFSGVPSGFSFDRRHPQLGQADLVVSCSSSPGCGVARIFPFALAPRVRYAASAWVRAAGAPVSLALVLGQDQGDYGSSIPKRVGSRWTRLSVAWTPQRSAPSPELSVQRAGGRGVVFAVDHVTLRDPVLGRGTAFLSSSALGAALAGDRASTYVPALSASAVRDSAVYGAGGGILVGLFVALAGIAAGRVAARRQSQA